MTGVDSAGMVAPCADVLLEQARCSQGLTLMARATLRTEHRALSTALGAALAQNSATAHTATLA